jgi:short-subunit dehydrogenase
MTTTTAALITGASFGIGAGYADRFARRGRMRISGTNSTRPARP